MMKFALLLMSVFCLAAVAQADETKWKGFAREVFPFDGRPAFVTKPANPAPGRPWVWRTSFPDFHSEIDVELLQRGYHVAYVDVVAMLGSDRALEIMERFQHTVIARFTLADKPALEAVSRGGLHAYRYAAKHPERIACIYADTPVLNLASWPLEHAGAKNELAAALKEYGLKDADELRAFRGNPIDLLEPIAKAKLPLRHVISLSDTVVPPEKNTLEAKRRLEALGHTMDLVTVEKGTPESNGHHFPLPAVKESADFIEKNTKTPAP